MKIPCKKCGTDCDIPEGIAVEGATCGKCWQELHAGPYWYPLFSLMIENHELILADDECNQIARAVDACRAATGIEALVCQDIATRQRQGIAKYGKTVAGNPLPLSDWLRHAYEEALDLAIYLRRAMREIEQEGKR